MKRKFGEAVICIDLRDCAVVNCDDARTSVSFENEILVYVVAWVITLNNAGTFIMNWPFYQNKACSLSEKRPVFIDEKTSILKVILSRIKIKATECDRLILFN